MKQRIIVSLYGGLGNQLFQYATGLALSQKHSAQLILDLGWFESVLKQSTVTNRAYALAPFGVACESVSLLPKRGILKRLSKWLPIKLADDLGIPIYFEKNYQFDLNLNALSLPVHLDGYWQSYYYFDAIKPLLRQILCKPTQMDEANQKVLHRIRNSHSVCLHVRRGDYVSNKNAAQHHGTCSIDYYQRAVSYLSGLFSEVTFYIFSDDMDWVRDNLEINGQHYYVSHNDGGAVVNDFWLMTACRHFIIANSSLSWWGAWLGADEEAKVIAPKQWFAVNHLDTKDLIPTHWIRM